MSRLIAAPSARPSSHTDPVVGRYRLDVSVESGCEALPAVTRTRSYTADIDVYSRAGADYVVRLYDATFVYGLTCFDPRFPQDRFDNGRLTATGTAHVEHWLSVNPYGYQACTTSAFCMTFTRQ
jgi:hypothetical protein